MSTSQFQKTVGFGGPGVKNRTEIKKEKDTLYKNAFGDLPDGTIYRDPLGMKTNGEAVELQKSRWDQLANHDVEAFANPSVAGTNEAMSVIEKWDELQRKGYSLTDTFTEIRKSLDTGDWTLPLDIIPDVFEVNPEQLPLVNTIPRVTTQDDEIVATPLTEYPDMSWGLEDTADENAEGDRVYEFAEPTYGDEPFPVQGMGAMTRLSDKMILSSTNLRNAESTQEQAMMRGAQQELERQMILGSDNDAGGFDGLNDFIADGDGEVIRTLDETDPAEDYEETLRDLINDAEFEGAAYEQLAIVTDFDFHRRVRNAITDLVRYEPMADAFGVDSVFEYDGVPVFKSHAIERISDQDADTTETKAYTVNLDAHYLGVLQEVNMRPLARIGPQERFAVDAYMALVAEDGGAHVRAAEVAT